MSVLRAPPGILCTDCMLPATNQGAHRTGDGGRDAIHITPEPDRDQEPPLLFPTPREACRTLSGLARCNLHPAIDPAVLLSCANLGYRPHSVQAARKMLRFAGPVRGGAVRALAVHGSTGARRAAGASGRLAGRPACVGLAASPLGPHRTGDAPVRWRSVATASERRLPGESIKLTTRDEIEGEHNESEMGIVVGTAAR